ncbi:energy transducer TonB [Gelidibacter salicanalis]|uniref:Energy transducer TonB n=1 Tax=Gelidibacter salicanalis TaxID=291193 RepID=A0A934KMR8_9FLAO|nr:energy transducer TonB [Gelidibacter salicanalis]MBJ7882216.1 energy transducer TonB [Gelidibacter salicanalis]
MTNFKKPDNVADEGRGRHVKSQKHDANLQKNATLYFQVGLILALLATYALFEMKFEGKNYQLSQIEIEEPFAEVTPELFQIAETIQPKSIDNQSKTIVLYKDPIIKPDDFETPPVDLLTEPEVYLDPIDPDKVKVVAPPEIDEPEIFNILGVEQVPIYPGCEDALTNTDRRNCMSDKLSALIKKTFNTNIASDMGLSGIQKIYVQFKIDESGKVTEILSRAPSEQLEEEAERVLSKVPQMVPGKQRHRPVSVMYTLPIIFDVQ